MKKTWECSHVEVIHSRITTEEYNQLLDEWAQIIYCHICQLHEIDLKVPNLNALSEQKRTGTND